MRTVETVSALVTALQSGDLELAATLLSEDCVVSGFTPEPLKRDEFLALQSQLLAAMPDFSYNLSQIDAEGKNAHAFITITGTNTNNLELPEFGLRSIPATGLQIVLPQVPSSWRVRHEAVVKIEMEEVPGGGLTGLLQQIGDELPTAPRVGEIDQRNLTS
ncbi:hypothetical protein KSF_045530 [Reticulibacter mediterranei]|uniref:SnoaL-like domain-containing protein n=1 Tax=Reticulibacter mediterranei TaxID=2778369 RepID=A0A8J3IL88_9CHLR|nr:nuclear transport factor 2 family protein [Reticulibacter mediterranei]GHO94505.1 hypothetical protein KSF_045530 [Reticulibacter mediterranei]